MNRLLPPLHMRGALLKGGIVGLTVVAATLLYLWQHFVVVQTGYRVEHARARLAQLQHREGELLVEAASLASLDRIERIARERLGMTTPSPDQLVRVIETPTDPARPGSGEAPVILAARAAP